MHGHVVAQTKGVVHKASGLKAAETTLISWLWPHEAGDFAEDCPVSRKFGFFDACANPQREISYIR